MGLGYAWSQLWKGNPSDAFNGLFIADDTIAASDAVANNLQKKVAEQQSNGLVSAEEAGKLYSDISATDYNTTPISEMAANYNLETPGEGFVEGLNDGARGIRNFIGSSINRVTGLGFKLIPWQVYVIGALVLLVWSYPFWAPWLAALVGGGRRAAK